MTTAGTQEVLGAPSGAAIFLVLTVRDGHESAVRDILSDIGGLRRSVGFRAPHAGLALVTGIGSALWDRMYGAPRPAGLHPFAEVVGGKHTAVATPGDLLFHLRAERMDLCFELAGLLRDKLRAHADIVDEVHGFRYFDQRDLLGFVDGTENPEGADAFAAAYVGAEDPTFARGSYVLVQKYLHDLDAWNALSVTEQERVIGRTKLSDVELDDEIQPTNSHVTLNTIEDDAGGDTDIVRNNMPFGSLADGEFGTYFIAFAADPAAIEQKVRNMFIGVPPGNYDRILDFSDAVTGGLFFAPTAALMERLGDGPLETRAAEPDPDDSDDAVAETIDTAGSLGIGSVKRRTA